MRSHEPTVLLDCVSRGNVVAQFPPLAVKRECFPLLVPESRFGLLLRDSRCRRTKAAGCLLVTQTGEGDLATLRARLSPVQCKPVDLLTLKRLDFSQELIGLGQFALVDRSLSRSSKDSDFRAVSGLSRSRCVQCLEAFCELDKLPRDLLGWNVGFAEHI